MPLELTKLTSEKLRSLNPATTVFFFPVGPLEDHGAHLPLGLDLAEAERLCFMAAERLERELAGWTGIVMPPAPLGIESDTSKVAVRVRAHVLRDWLVDSCRSLARAGFLHFTCFSGHLGPRQLTAIEDAGKIISKGKLWMFRGWRSLSRPGRARPTLVSACSALVTPAMVRESPFWPDPLEHGGARDTSVALAASAAIEGSYSSLPTLERGGTRWSRFRDLRRHRRAGYWGAPSTATVEQGQRVLQGTLDQVFPKLRAVWEGSNPEAIFRSWYSVLPPNKSFFTLWVLSVSMVLLLLGWLWMWWSLMVSGVI